ncbi:MAG TPA: PxKF domain-containing protein [Anaerolineales bacterium]|nr:PxKF domain-containing protein [Anaerolineales bacterium]
MQTNLFPKWLRLIAVVLLLLTSFSASPAQADATAPGGIISASIYHTCALKPDGSVDCWGLNNYGEAEDQPGPYIQVSAGEAHTCALTPAGAVDCWGYNGYGETDHQPGPYLQVSAGFRHTCALTPAGAIDCWGWNDYGQSEDQPGPYTQVSAGHDRYTCALTPAGAVDCWGNNMFGRADDKPGPYAQVAAGYAHTCALTPVGAVECWGYYVYGQTDPQPGPYIQVSVGSVHTCALTPAGAVDCWGRNHYGQAEDQPGPYTQVTAGQWHTCALTPAGAVDCWGSNGYGQAEDQPGPYGPYDPIIDTTPPTVTVTGVTEGSTYILGAVPQAGCSTTDEGSGVTVEASLSLSGGNTLGVGVFNATCSGALDNAGNPGNIATVSYSVTFQFTGFLAPVDNPPILNVARAGQVIPLKWRLTDASGNPILGLTDVTLSATSLACDAGTSGDALEEYAASASGLQSLGDGYYQWNWKTPTSYANSCKTLGLDLGEGSGSQHTALFKFKK